MRHKNVRTLEVLVGPLVSLVSLVVSEIILAVIFVTDGGEPVGSLFERDVSARIYVPVGLDHSI